MNRIVLSVSSFQTAGRHFAVWSALQRQRPVNDLHFGIGSWLIVRCYIIVSNGPKTLVPA